MKTALTWLDKFPMYWGRQALYTGGREAAVRYLLTSLVTFVGEEAVLVFSGRAGGQGDKESSPLDARKEEGEPDSAGEPVD